MATGTAGVLGSIQAAAGFVPNRTPAQRSRLARDGELLHRSLPDGEDSMILALFGEGWPRILLLASGVLCLVLAYGSMLQNGV
jgi:hypothetical protein